MYNPRSISARVRLAGFPYRLAVTTILALVSLYLAFQTLLTLRWPIDHDGAFLHTIAFQIDHHGLVPYRDIHESSLPLVYLFHLAIGKSAGYGELAFRIADLLWLGALSLATWRMMRPLGALVAWAAALVFVLLYQSYGPAMTLQRDYLALLPVVAAIWLAGKPGGRAKFLAIGALFGLAAGVKPHFALALPLVLVYALASQKPSVNWRRPSRQAFGALAWAAAGLLVTAALPLLWVWQAGGLTHWWAFMTSYLPLYNELTGNQELLGRGERLIYVFNSVQTLGGRAALLIPVALGVWFGLFEARLSAPQRRLVALLAALLPLFVVYVVLAGKFWTYHWMPFFYFAACCGALVLLPFQTRSSPRDRRTVALAVFIAGLALTLRPAPDIYRQLNGLPPAPVAGGRADRMTDFLSRELRPGDTVQTLDGVTGGGATAIRRAGARLATPYINDTQFYHHISSPVVQGLRQDFMGRLKADPPRFIIDVPDASRPRGPGTGNFPELERFLAERYRVALDRDGVIIYERED